MQREYGKVVMSKKLMLGSLIILLEVLLTACGQGAVQETQVTLEPETEQILFETAAADYGEVVLSEKLLCTYRQVEDQEICFPVSGKTIDQIYVNIGDTVQKGDLLASLVTEGLDERIAKTEYHLARQKLLLDQNERNLQNDIDALNVQYTYHSEQTSSDWAEKEKQLAEIEQEHRYLREDYSDAISLDEAELAVLHKEQEESCIYAKIDGTISSVERNLEGSVCVKDDPIMTIIDPSECLFELEKQEYSDYFKAGEPVTMTITTGNGKGDYVLLPYDMEHWGDKQLFSIEEQPEGAVLEVGATGNLLLVMEEKEHVLRVPKSAVHNADGKDYVYMTDKDGMRQMVYVEAGLKGDGYTEILSGLQEGEKVILQ